jgi:hypothetical protein
MPQGSPGVMAMGWVIKGVGKKDVDVIRWDFNKRSQGLQAGLSISMKRCCNPRFCATWAAKAGAP